MKNQKLINSIQKALGQHLGTDALPEPVLELATTYAEANSKKILERILPELTPGTVVVGSTLVLVGMISGFLCGWLYVENSNAVPLPVLQGDPNEASVEYDDIDDFFQHAYQIKAEAQLFGTHTSTIIFSNLRKGSPLIEGLTDPEVNKLEEILKRSLTAGMMQGFEKRTNL